MTTKQRVTNRTLPQGGCASLASQLLQDLKITRHKPPLVLWVRLHRDTRESLDEFTNGVKLMHTKLLGECSQLEVAFTEA